MKNNRDTFLEHPRRGKSLVAPYKAKSQYGTVSIVILILALSLPLAAQHRDTLYAVEEEMVYDTLFVHDTLRTYDTVSLDEYIHSREFEQLFYSSGYVDSQQHKVIVVGELIYPNISATATDIRTTNNCYSE